MISRSLLAKTLTVLLFAAGWSAQAGAEDRVYQYKTKDGRTVYTNLTNQSIRGQDLKALDLVPLAKIDVDQVAAEQVAPLNMRVEETHEALQSSERCEAIRADSRVPQRVWMWREHRRELTTAAGLFLFSLVVGFAWRGRWMRTLMPIAPFAGAVYLGYFSAAQAQARVDGLHTGLRACSAALPEGDPQSRDTLKTRISSVLDLQSKIDRVYEARDLAVEAAMREAGR